jgi:hypothetical protein
MVDLINMKLGKLPARHLMGLPVLSSYALSLPEAPSCVDWSVGIPVFGVMANDKIGNCTAAAAAHAIQTWTLAESGAEVTLSDDEVVAFYSASTGYDPADSSTDQGGVESSVLSYWHKNPIRDYSLDGFVAVNAKSKLSIKDAIWVFGGAYLGIQLPISAQRQLVWDVPAEGVTGMGAPGSWGGHAVWAVAYDSRTVTVVTWGMRKALTWEFLATYGEEAYALLSGAWTAKDAISPSGFDFVTLRDDLSKFHNQ